MHRLLMTCDAVGGVWQFSIELTRGLVESGCDVLLAVLGPGMNESRRQEAVAAGAQLAEHPGKLEWMEDAWDDVEASGRWLMEQAATFRPDIIHLHSYAHGALPWEAPVVITAHSCVASWMHVVKGEELGPDWARYRDAVRCGLAGAGMVIAPTRSMLGELERYGVQLACTGVIPNGRSSDVFFPGAKEPFVFTAGRLWDEGKNIQLLEKVAGSLPWPIFAAGDGPVESNSEVRHAGRLNEAQMMDWYSRAGIYAHPALYEPFGLSVLEAALSGCALLLSDIPSLRENWEGAARFADPRDQEAWKRELCRLIADEELRKALGREARLRGLRFSPAATTRAYRDAYSLVLRQTRNFISRSELRTQCTSLFSATRSDPTGTTETPTFSAVS